MPQLSAMGFAMALVDASNGALLAFAYGAPPTWVDTSAAAELWALFTLLQMSPEQPVTITDCKGMLDELRRGREAATAHDRRNARLWSSGIHAANTTPPGTELVRAAGFKVLPPHLKQKQ